MCQLSMDVPAADRPIFVLVSARTSVGKWTRIETSLLPPLTEK
jgi:hypothetical protein